MPRKGPAPKRPLIQDPVSGSQLTPYFSPSRLLAAFLMMAWQSETDISWLFRQ